MTDETSDETPIDTPVVARKGPFPVELVEGKTYFWCACGRSQNQPFCDGSHKVTGLTPVKFTAEASKRAFLCGCKNSSNKPFCDGTHKSL